MPTSELSISGVAREAAPPSDEFPIPLQGRGPRSFAAVSKRLWVYHRRPRQAGVAQLGEPTARPRPRIESLSDLIFGLALSIGAIALIGNPPSTVMGLFEDLLTFGFSFLILISVWMRYTRVMSVLPLETRRTILLNVVLLFAVSIEPFLFNILRSNTSAALSDASSALYGLDLGAIMLVMGIFLSPSPTKRGDWCLGT